MKKYCLLICGAGVAIIGYTHTIAHSQRNIDLFKSGATQIIKIEGRSKELKRDTFVSVGYPVRKSPSSKFVR